MSIHDQSLAFRLLYIQRHPDGVILLTRHELRRLKYKTLRGATWHEIVVVEPVSGSSYKCKLGKPIGG
jgi:hypothetical protein